MFGFAVSMLLFGAVSLAALYHLAQNGEAAKSWKGVDALLLDAGIKAVPKAATAVFVGTDSMLSTAVAAMESRSGRPRGAMARSAGAVVSRYR
jgi:hypothetical protein